MQCYTAVAAAALAQAQTQVQAQAEAQTQAAGTQRGPITRGQEQHLCAVRGLRVVDQLEAEGHQRGQPARPVPEPRLERFVALRAVQARGLVDGPTRRLI